MFIKALLAVLAALVPAASAQVEERIFTRSQEQPEQRLQDLATVIRNVGRTRDTTFHYDIERKILMVRGTADEIHLAEWLNAALDRPGSVLDEYPIPGPAGERLRVFRLVYAHSPRDINAMHFLFRALADITYAEPHA